LEHPEDATMTFVIPENPRSYPLTLTAKYVKGSNPEVTPSATPDVTPIGTPAASPSVPPTASPEVEPSATPNARPTGAPVVSPSAPPEEKPTATPTGTPSESTHNPEPIIEPGQSPTASPNHKSDSETTSSPEDDTDIESDETLSNNIITDDKNIAMVRITNFKKKEVEYVKPHGKVKSTLVIPKTVTVNKTIYKVISIANDAFKGNKKLMKVTIGNNIQIIGDRAFMNCAKLKRVTIGNNAEKVGTKAFYGDKKLTKLTIQSTKLTRNSIGTKAFAKGNKELVVKVPKNRLKLYQKVLTVKGISKNATIK
ncbi:MAG: leucine-rich repeat protein, partial [Eubacterium sp.]